MRLTCACLVSLLSFRAGQVFRPDAKAKSNELMLKEKLNELVNLCKRIGLRDSDYSAIISLINNGEYKVAIEWLIDQLYEYEINIPSELCSEIKRKANEMGVSNDRAKLLDELSSSARGTKHT